MGLLLFLRDLVVALYDQVTGRERRRYVAWVDVAAPRAVVWELIKSRDTRYDGRFPLRIVAEPIPGLPGHDRVRILAGDVRVEMHTRIADERAEEAILYELLPDGTDPRLIEGRDDYIGFLLADRAGGTRLELVREASPVNFVRRLTIPLGLRSGGRRYQRKAEAMWRERGDGARHRASGP